VAEIRPAPPKSVRPFKGIICDDISEFESYMPSQPVGSLCAMSGSQKYARHSRELAKRYEVSRAQFSEFLAAMGQFLSPVSGREFSISVSRRQRLASKSHETGSIRGDVPRFEVAQPVRSGSRDRLTHTFPLEINRVVQRSKRSFEDSLRDVIPECSAYLRRILPASSTVPKISPSGHSVQCQH
jgi:hypothetical protein